MQPVEMKRVLAAIDFSEWTAPVLQTATEIAGRYGAQLTVAYAEMFLPSPTSRKQRSSRFRDDPHPGDAACGLPGVDGGSALKAPPFPQGIRR